MYTAGYVTGFRRIDEKPNSKTDVWQNFKYNKAGIGQKN